MKCLGEMHKCVFEAQEKTFLEGGGGLYASSFMKVTNFIFLDKKLYCLYALLSQFARCYYVLDIMTYTIIR